MRRGLFVLVLGLLGVAAAPATPATVRGRVLFGSKGVSGARVSLVERDRAPGTVGPGEALSADADGRFEFASVDASRAWRLVVFDPFRQGEIGLVTEARVDGLNELSIKCPIRVLEPAADFVVPGPRARVRFTPVPGAASYTLEVEDRESLARASRKLRAPEVSLLVQPARCYALNVAAHDESGAEIGASTTIHTFGVSDPEAEREMAPMEADCVIAGLLPRLRVAPSPSPGAQASFVVSRGDRVRVLWRWKEWRKVTTLDGQSSGRSGWLSEGEVVCP